MAWTCICDTRFWTWLHTSWDMGTRKFPTRGARLSMILKTSFHRSDGERTWENTGAGGKFGLDTEPWPCWKISATVLGSAGTPSKDTAGSGMSSSLGMSVSSGSRSTAGWLGCCGESRSIGWETLARLLGLKENRLRLLGGASSCSPTQACSRDFNIHEATFRANPGQYEAQNFVRDMRWPWIETLPSICWCSWLLSHLAGISCWIMNGSVEKTGLDFRRNLLEKGCFKPKVHMSKPALRVNGWIGWKQSSCGIVELFGCSKWKCRLLLTWNWHKAAHSSTCWSSCLRKRWTRSKSLTLLYWFNLDHPPKDHIPVQPKCWVVDVDQWFSTAFYDPQQWMNHRLHGWTEWHWDLSS